MYIYVVLATNPKGQGFVLSKAFNQIRRAHAFATNWQDDPRNAGWTTRVETVDAPTDPMD